ncbi:MAG: YggS family pyridoxal phosphate-dependent enzyme [Clostridiales bacterium]|jgi:pyridoxal phosphate enzyme (YggS family)|nr:YggS family pyridoxal phosphate-dependent enzyme [Clostridiales bacterium]
MTLRERIDNTLERIEAACARAGRSPSEVTLIAVSKTQPPTAVEEAYNLGIRHFGENKVQELVQKYEGLKGVCTDINWHLIGHLQRNKVKQAIDKAVLIHSVDSLRLGQMIEQEASKKNLVCDVLIQLNIAREDTKFGVAEEELMSLFMELIKLPHLRIRGLMAIAPYVDDPEKNRKYFSKMRQLFIDIKTKNIDNGLTDIYFNPDSFDTLSMGMTGDFEVAVEEGATMVRIGTGIFGERSYSIK